MNTQLEGLEDLEGTYPFDIRHSYQARRVNRFLWNLRLPEVREKFARDELATLREAGLNPHEIELVMQRNWLGLVQYGVTLFVLEKMARAVKVSNLEVYAMMRGESFEDFMKTRQVPDAR